MIFSAVFAILFVTCLPYSKAGTTERNCTYEYVGCYRDRVTDRAYDQLYANFRGKKTKTGERYIQWGKPWSNFTNVIEGCCDALITSNMYSDNYYFGVQFYGECWTYKENSSFLMDYKKHGKSTNCIRADCNATDEVGRNCTNAIYCAFECGKKTPGADTRIVNGGKVILPFMAALFKGNRFFCGATLISCSWLLTAAHCFTNQTNVTEINLQMGYYALLGDPRLNKGRKYVFNKVHIHHKYTGFPILDYDVALIKLNKVVKLDHKVHPICLNFKNVFADQEDAVDEGWRGKNYDVAGWGSTMFYFGPPSPDLLKTDVNEAAAIWCAKFVPMTKRKACFTSGGPVAIGLGKGVCSGDAGGAFYHVSNGKHIQVAVVSHAEVDWNINGNLVCAWPNTYIIGTKVNVVIGWIKEICKNNPSRLEYLEPPEPLYLQ